MAHLKVNLSKPSGLFLCTIRFSIQQDRQCTYKVTLRRVHVIITVMEKH